SRRFGRRRPGGEPQARGGQVQGQFEQESAHDDTRRETEERLAKSSSRSERASLSGGPGLLRSAPFSRLCIAVLGLCFSTAVMAVDVNVATPDQLRSVKGIGAKTAELIIE